MCRLGYRSKRKKGKKMEREVKRNVNIIRINHLVVFFFEISILVKLIMPSPLKKELTVRQKAFHCYVTIKCNNNGTPRYLYNA